MSDSGGRVSIWVVAVGTLLGGLGGVATVVAVVHDYDNPLAQAILDDKHRLNSNNRATQEAYLEERHRDDAAWNAALAANSPESYAAYVETFPAGLHLQDALARRAAALEERAWQQALRLDTIEGYEIYLASYPNGARAGAANSNRDRLRAAGGSQRFSIMAVSGIARTAVQRARSGAIYAEEAQRRARRGQAGYMSTYHGSSLASARYGGEFEGRTTQMSNGIWTMDVPYQGIWTFADGRERPTSSPISIVTFKGQISTSSWLSTSGSVIGEATYTDGRKYEGELSISMFSRTFSQNGMGALWTREGMLIGSGRWEDGELVQQQ